MQGERAVSAVAGTAGEWTPGLIQAGVIGRLLCWPGIWRRTGGTKVASGGHGQVACPPRSSTTAATSLWCLAATFLPS